MCRLFGLRMRGECRHGRVGVVLEAGRTDGWTDAWMDGWMEEVGVARVGEEKGEKRVIEGGNMGQNLAINTKKKSEGGGISGAVIDASIGIFFVSLHC